jgi:hypothetical protein
MHPRLVGGRIERYCGAAAMAVARQAGTKTSLESRPAAPL